MSSSSPRTMSTDQAKAEADNVRRALGATGNWHAALCKGWLISTMQTRTIWFLESTEAVLRLGIERDEEENSVMNELLEAEHFDRTIYALEEDMDFAGPILSEFRRTKPLDQWDHARMDIEAREENDRRTMADFENATWSTFPNLEQLDFLECRESLTRRMLSKRVISDYEIFVLAEGWEPIQRLLYERDETRTRRVLHNATAASDAEAILALDDAEDAHRRRWTGNEKIARTHIAMLCLEDAARSVIAAEQRASRPRYQPPPKPKRCIRCGVVVKLTFGGTELEGHRQVCTGPPAPAPSLVSTGVGPQGPADICQYCGCWVQQLSTHECAAKKAVLKASSRVSPPRSSLNVVGSTQRLQIEAETKQLNEHDLKLQKLLSRHVSSPVARMTVREALKPSPASPRAAGLSVSAADRERQRIVALNNWLRCTQCGKSVPEALLPAHSQSGCIVVVLRQKLASLEALAADDGNRDKASRRPIQHFGKGLPVTAGTIEEATKDLASIAAVVPSVQAVRVRGIGHLRNLLPGIRQSLETWLGPENPAKVGSESPPDAKVAAPSSPHDAVLTPTAKALTKILHPPLPDPSPKPIPSAAATRHMSSPLHGKPRHLPALEQIPTSVLKLARLVCDGVISVSEATRSAHEIVSKK